MPPEGHETNKKELSDSFEIAVLPLNLSAENDRFASTLPLVQICDLIVFFVLFGVSDGHR